ncbi:retrovirus-related pol polyprotein from transposon TNT 1-94 [Tanacetum coccineum]
MQDKKPDLSFFHVFGSLCYPTNDHDDLGKFDAKADIGIFVGYVPVKKVFRIYNKRTRIITETIHVTFNELTAMASEQFSSGPGLQHMTPATSSTGLVSTLLRISKSAFSKANFDLLLQLDYLIACRKSYNFELDLGMIDFQSQYNVDILGEVIPCIVEPDSIDL